MMSTTSSVCSLVPLVQSLQFKSGSLSKPASDKGHGEFQWPSGLKYVGEYLERKRHGYGVQLWPDGAKYEGHFHEDQRQGMGKHHWENGEEYEGEYWGDKKHGSGVYRWPSGAYVSGQFSRDCKEGLCMYVSTDGEKFEGFYHNDERDGEGVLTYPGGRQDVGVWKGTKLVKLRFTVKEAYFDPTSHSHPLKSPNSSLGSLNFRERGKFGPKGPLEVASEELIQAASCGEVAKVSSVLKMGAVHVDVMDRNGHTALFAAAIHSHLEVVNVLLDNGADVNRLDSVEITALNACHHILYCSLPQVKDLLMRIPQLKYPQSLSSPPHSTTLTDCTLHTSDFLSTPHSLNSHPPVSHNSHPLHPHNSHSHPHASHHPLNGPHSHPHGFSSACFECQGTTIPTTEDIPTAHSYPLISSSTDTAHESQNNFVREHRRSNSVDSAEMSQSTHTHNVPLMEVPHIIPHQLTLTSTANPIAAVRHATQGSSLPLWADSPTDRILTSAVEEEAPLDDDVLEHSESGDIVTASANGDILGVSAISPYLYSSNEACFPDDDVSRPALPSQGSSLSRESSTDMPITKAVVLSVTTPEPIEMQENFAPELSFEMKKPNPLYLLPGQDPRSSLYSSSMFSSSQYGPIVSAAQSTTLSCGSVSLDDVTAPSDSSAVAVLEPRCSTPESIIDLLLRRGGDPNESSLPLTPLIYSIRSGDVQAVYRLVKRGADVNHPLPSEVGGHSPLMETISLEGPNPVPIVEHLVKNGARVNLPLSTPSSSALSCDEADTNSGDSVEADSGDTAEGESAEDEESEVLAGENQGEGVYTPLHWACLHREHTKMKQEELSSTVLAIVNSLLEGGATIDVVSRGHSPLSLAIINGHDKVVERLLTGGADPSLPLGQGVGTALCSIITHAALKKRDASTSLRLVNQLLEHGADFTQPVRVTGMSALGTVTDFAHATFKEDKRLSCLKYSALSKSERTRYLAWKKLINDFVNLFKCKALHTIALRENAWLQVQIDQQVDNRLQARRERLLRTSSVIHIKQTVAHKRSRTIQSAGGVPIKAASRADILPSFPLLTLKTSVRKVTKHHGPTLTGAQSSEPEGEVMVVSNGKVQEKRIHQLKELFGLAIEMFSSTCPEDLEGDEVCVGDSAGQKSGNSHIRSPTPHTPQWTLSSFCYECGRSSGVHLVRCPGCQYVYYCSQTCRMEGYRKGHKEECKGGFVKQTAGKGSKPSNSRKIHSANI